MRLRLATFLLSSSCVGACAPSPSSQLSAEAIHDRSAVKVATIASSNSHTDLSYDTAGTHLVRQAFSFGTGLASTTDYTYEGDRIVRETFTNLSTALVTTTSYAYDVDRLVRVSTDQSGTMSSLTYAYDEAGALVSMASSGGSVRQLVYDAKKRLDSITSDSGSWKFGYDGAGRLATLQDGAGEDYTLTYGDGDKVTLVTSAQGRRYDFEYDAQGRLATLTQAIGGPAFVDHYTYVDGEMVNMSLKTALDGNYELRNFVDLEGNTFSHPDPRQLAPNL